MAEDLGAQLQIQNQINAAIAKRSKTLKAQAGLLQGQVRLAQELCNALECTDLDGMEERLATIQEGMQNASDEAERMASHQRALGDAAKDSSDQVNTTTSGVQKLADALKPARVAAVGLGVGMVDAMRGAMAQVKATIKLAKSLGRSLFGVGASIVKLPFRLLGGLTQMANDAAQAGLGLRQAYEDVRKEFGDLASGPGHEVVGAFKDLKSSSGNIAGTGLSMSKVFGFGPDGAAKALKEFAEQAKGMGPAFHHFGSEIASMGPEFIAYTKGMGLSGEATGSLARMAMTTGKTLKETLGEVSNYALQMGEAFGMSSKEIAQDMATMAGDVAHFGQMAPKTLAQVSVYARRLGLDIKSLTGVIDKFDNFEDAAKSASMLSQAFGMNVDAMKMMNEQDPAKRMETLRQAFFNTGKSVEDLSRQELKLLSSQMGLDEASTKLALSNENMGYDDIKNAGKDAKDNSLSQAEAMQQLGKSIERVVEIGQQFKGFFDALISGFMRGVMYSKEFRKLLGNLRRSIQVVFFKAAELGDLFITKFPGVMKMVKSLQQLFDPRKWSTMMDGVIGAFKEFAETIKTDPKAGIEALMNNLKSVFRDFWSGGEAGKEFLEGLKEFFSTIAILAMQAVPLMINAVAGMIQKVADFIANPGGMGSGTIGPALRSAFESSFEAIKEALPKLGAAIMNLISIVWQKYKGPIMKVGAAYGAIVFGKMLLTAALTAVKGAVVGKIAGIFGSFFGSTTKAAASKAGNNTASKRLGKALKQGFTQVAQGAKSFFTAIANIKPTEIFRAGLSIGAAAIVFGGVMITFATALWAVGAILSGLSFADIAKSLFGIAGAIGALLFMMVPAALLTADGGMTMGLALIGMLAGAGLLTIGGVAFAAALYIVSAALSGLSERTIVTSLGVLAAASLALVGLVVAGAVLAGMGPAFFAAIVGIALAPALLGAIGVGFINSLIEIGNAARQITDPQGVALGFAAIAVAVAALAILVGAGALIGMMISAVPAAIAGMAAGALLLWVLPDIMPAIAATAKAIRATKINWRATAKTFMHVAKIMGYLALVGVAAAAAGAASLLGVIGLGLTVYMLAALPGVIEWLGASAKATKEKNVDWAEAAKTFWSITEIMGHLAIMGLSAALAGAAAVVGVIGLVAMIPFLWKLPGTIEAIAEANTKFTSLKLGGSDKNFATLAKVIEYIGDAGSNAAAAAGGALIGYLTVGAVSSFAEKLVEEGGLMTSISTFSENANVLTPALNKKLEILSSFFEVLGEAGATAISLLPFTMPWIGDILMSGFGMVGTFSTKIKDQLVPAVNALNSIKIANPREFNQKVEAIGEVFSIIGTMADIAKSIASMDMAAMEEGAEAGTMLDAVSTMMSVLLDGTKELITSTIDAVKGMSLADVQKAAKVGELFAGIGTMVQAMMPPKEFFEAIKKTTKRSVAWGLASRESTDASANAGPVIEAMGSYIVKIMDSVKGVIPGLVKSVTDAASQIQNPEQMEPKIKLVAAAIDVVAKIGQTMKTMSEVALKIQENAGEDTNIYRALNMFRTLMTSIKNTIKDNLKSIIDSVKEAAESIGDPAVLEPKMKIVTAAMDVVVKFGDTIQKISELMPDADQMSEATGNDITARIAAMTSAIQSIVSQIQTSLPALVTTITGMDIPSNNTAKNKMSVIVDAMEATAKFAEAMQKVKSLIPEGGDMTAATTTMKSAVQSLVGMFQTSDENNTIPSLIDTLVRSNIGVHKRSLERAADSMQPLQTFIDRYVSLVDTINSRLTANQSTVVAAVTDMIGNYNSIRNVLGANTVVGLQAELDRFGQNMSISSGRIRIENSPVQITVRLDLKLDGNRLAHQLTSRRGVSVVTTNNLNHQSMPANTSEMPYSRTSEIVPGTSVADGRRLLSRNWRQ